MRPSLAIKLFALGFLGMIFISMSYAFAADVNIPYSNIDRRSFSVTVNDLKPAACDSLYLTNIISSSGLITGTSANDLIIGSAGADQIDGAGGDDCIVGGNGDDLITGSDGNDICMGGLGTDLFTSCETEYE